MFNNIFKREYSVKMKSYEMTAWKYDIESYHRIKKIRELAIKCGRDIAWHDNYLKTIRDRWPNVKSWD